MRPPASQAKSGIDEKAMVSKAPSSERLKDELVCEVARIYHSNERDQLSVNLVRQRVESKLGLAEGFLKVTKWKGESKKIIRDAVDELESIGHSTPLSPAPLTTQDTQPAHGTKRAPPKQAISGTKRRQKTGPEKLSSTTNEADVAELSDESPKRKKPAIWAKSKRRVVESDPEEAADDVEDNKTSRVSGSDSSESEVIDEPRKQKRKPPGPPVKGRGKSKGDAPKPVAEPSLDDAEVRKLQGQLARCGVRKIWGVELKKYGNDSRAKIRHLKGMLKDVGMDGRFSESKAREVKERRELLADLEAVQEMNSHWGVSGSRRTRGRGAPSKPTKLPSDSGNEGGSEDDDGDGGGDDDDNEDQEVSGSDNGDDGSASGGSESQSGGDESSHDESSHDEDDQQPKEEPRRGGSAKRRADMAFLGDESESE